MTLRPLPGFKSLETHLTGDTRLDESADEFQRIGDGWEALGAWFRQVSEAPDPASHLGECVATFNALADLEETTWRQLRNAMWETDERCEAMENSFAMSRFLW